MSNDHECETIRNWVWSGFYSPHDVRERLGDILEDEDQRPSLLQFIDEEFERKRVAETGWPEVTDFDRLHAIFYKLHEQGICALHNAGYTMSDGYSDVTEANAAAPADHYHGYCFYHGQDVERAVDGHGLMIAFGDLRDRATEGRAVGEVVADALRAGGFTVEWDGTIDKRIDLPEIDWKQRSPKPGRRPIPSSTAVRPVPTPDEPDATPPAKAWWQFWR